MTHRFLTLVFSLLAGIFALGLLAQGSIPTRTLSTKDGLAESTNFFMHRAANGLMYISSMNGTNIFDGQTVQVFREDHTPPGPHHYLGKFNQGPFLETSKGNVWFSTDKAIVCHQASNGFFKSYQIDSTLESARYYAFAIEQDRYLWVIFNQLLYRLDLNQPKTIAITPPMAQMDFARGEVRRNSNGKVTEVLGSFWIRPGLLRLSIDEQGLAGKVDTMDYLPNEAPTPALMQWIADEKGNLYVTSFKQLHIFPANEQDEFQAINLPPDVRSVNGMAWRKPGILWISTQRGFLEYDSYSRQIRLLGERETGINSTLFGGHYLYIDRDILNQREILWLAKNNHPIVYGNLEANNFNNYLKHLPTSQRKPFILDSGINGSLRFVNQMGEHFLDSSGHTTENRYDANNASAIEISGHQFKLGVGFNKLLWLDHSTGNWLFVNNVPVKSILDITTIDSLIVISDIGGTVSFFKVNQASKKPSNLSFDSVHVAVNLGPIMNMVYDNYRQLLWVASSTGLHWIDPITHKSQHYTLKNGLPVENLSSVVVAKDQTLWLGSNQGVFDFNPDEFPYSTFHFTLEDGLSANEFLPGMACRTSDGRLAFGSTNGIDVFHPDSLRTTHLPARAMFRNLKIHGKNWVGEKALRLTKSIDLPYNQSSLTISFAAPEFAAPKRTEFQLLTQINSEQHDTTYLGTANVFNFPNLAPATYRFGIMARAKGNLSFDPPKWLSVTIHPHWTGAGWFKALVIIASLMLASLIVAAWFRYQLRVQEALAAEERMLASQREARLQRKIDLEDQRRRITSRMHNDIGGSLTTLSMLSSRLSRTKDLERAGEISNKISHWAKDVRRRVSSFLRVMNPNFDQLEKLVGVLRTYAADVLTDNELRAEFDFPDNYPDYELAPDFSIALLEITQEVINNVLKYADATKVSMQLKVKGEEIFLSITDNGSGFVPTEEDFKKGIGLSSLKSLAKKFGGDISYGPGTDGKGTAVNCHLVVGRWQEE